MTKQALEKNSLTKKIYEFREKKVMLDKDLAELYEVTTGNLNKAMKRNKDRFPEEFAFQLTSEEIQECSRFQNGILNRGQNIKYLPYVYTEHGILMLSSVLKSKIAIQTNIKIIKVFIELRKEITTYTDISLLKQQLLKIEAEHKVDSKVLSDKMMHLNKKVFQISQVLDQFQESNIIIKRPKGGDYKG